MADKGAGKRFNEGKNRLDLIPSFSQEQIAKVFTFGADLYGTDNYRAGMKWSKCLASLKRHIQAFEEGKDFDSDPRNTYNTYHIAHAAVNCMFLLEYYKCFPEGDDRNAPWKTLPSIGLDLDGVICDFSGSYNRELEKAGFNPSPWKHWGMPYGTEKVWEKVSKDKDFWMNIEPLCDGASLPFEPCAYITYRPIPKEWVQEWLFKHSFPCEKVYVLEEGGSKYDTVKASGADVFVDDKFKTFQELNNKGMLCYLFDAPYNQKYDVGHLRIKSLEELVK